MRAPLGFIVEGHGEYDVFPSLISRMLGHCHFPINNAQGIGNIIKHTEKELLKLVRVARPEKIIITLDYREAERQKICDNCIELKNLVSSNCNLFLEKYRESPNVVVPEQIVVIIVDRTFETWLCADYLALKENALINGDLITNSYDNVDSEILNPNRWLIGKLKVKTDLKSKNNRKSIAKGIRPEIAAQNSRSFRKFYKEVIKVGISLGYIDDSNPQESFL